MSEFESYSSLISLFISRPMSPTEGPTRVNSQKFTYTESIIQLNYDYKHFIVFI